LRVSLDDTILKGKSIGSGEKEKKEKEKEKKGEFMI